MKRTYAKQVTPVASRLIYKGVIMTTHQTSFLHHLDTDDSQVVSIPLSKLGKHAGKYTAIIDAIDSDLAKTSWYVKISNQTQYACYKSKQNLYLHREVMARMLGRPLAKHELIDHIDGDGLNNRRANLRIATHQQNLANQRKQKRNTSSRFKGVAYYKRDKNWEAHIKKDGKKIYLGRFPTELEAHEAYVEEAKRLFGIYYNDGTGG